MKQIWHECYINGSKTNSRGVAILLNNNFEFKVSIVIKDDDANFLQLLVSCNELNINMIRVRNLKFATYLKFATCGNTNKINELR